MLTESEFAQECVFRGLFFGVNSHYLLGAAKLRSGINDDSVGNRIGPFRLNQTEWNDNSNDLSFGLKYQPSQITSWRRQCGVFGLMTYKTQNALHLELSRYPSAVELYERQFATGDTTQLSLDLAQALNATAGLLEPAAEAILDDPTLITGAIVDPNTPTMTEVPSPSDGLFDAKAPRIMQRLMDDFSFTKIQTAGVLGNFGHETGGFVHFQEAHPIAGQGGWGWAQWTGPRRTAFMAFANANGFEPASDEANYGFLTKELQSTEAASVPALKNTGSLEDATRVFEQSYERAGVVTLNSRIKFARKALAAFEDSQPA